MQGAQSLSSHLVSRNSTGYYQSIYAKYGAKGSALVAVPFDHDSKQDIKTLLDYTHNEEMNGSLGWDLDAIIPFAAIPKSGIELNSFDLNSKFAHRIM